jgi:hypothetical protein
VIVEDWEYRLEQWGLAVCLSLMGAAVATRIVVKWLDDSVDKAFGGAR